MFTPIYSAVLSAWRSLTEPSIPAVSNNITEPSALAISNRITINSNSALFCRRGDEFFIAEQALKILTYLNNNQVAQSEYTRLIKIVEMYRIDERQNLTSIIKTATKLNNVACALKYQEDQNDHHILEIVKELATQNNRLSVYIQNYEIRNEKDRIEIAKVSAAKYGRDTSEYVQNYGIKDEQALIEIAKLAAAESGRGTSAHIQNYGIKGEQTLIEIAKLAAAESGRGISEYIQNYGIKDEQALVEIAKIAAAHDGEGTSEYIKNYGIKNELALIEIAKIAAAQHGRRTSKYIQNYGINDEQALIEIAKIAAAYDTEGTFYDGEGTSAYIKNYRIKSEQALVEIAKIAAAHDGEGTSKYIQNYGINDEQALIEIAKIAAAQDGAWTSELIQNYEIKDEQALIEIAKIAVMQDVGGASACIRYYGIKNKKALIDIAKIAASRNLEETLRHIKEYKIKDVKTLSTFFYAGYGTHWIFRFGFLDLPHLYQVLEKDEILQSDLISVTQSLQASLSSSFLNSLAASLLKDISLPNLKPERLPALKNQIVWLVSLSEYISCQGIALEQLEGASDFLKDLIRYPDRAMRDKLTILLLDSFSEEMLTWQKNVNFSVTKGYTSLPALVLFSLLGGSQIDLGRELLQKFFHSKSSDFGEYQRIFIHFLENLYRNAQLSQEEKIDLLRRVFDDKHFSSNAIKKQIQYQELSIKFKKVIRAMEFASILCDHDRLQKINSIEDFVEQLGVLYQELDISAEDMQERYLEALGKFRNRHALLTYFGSLRRLPASQQETAINMLKQFVREVLDQTFKTKRYENSPHLEEIAKYYPLFLEQWKKGGEILIQQQSLTKESERNYIKFLSQKLIQDQHLGPHFAQQYPLLFEFLCDPANSSIDLQKIETDSFEDYCFRLMNSLSEEDEIKTLEGLLRVIPPHAEFRNDIQGLLNTSTQKQLDIRIVDTDDPCDLLLIGTEVQGSCQRVDGDPKNNVGLLGYLMDGKIRAVVVKDKNGKILGRSLIRPLWDRTKQQVVLQQDRYYGDEKYQKLVNEGCEARAAQLNIPLVVERKTVPYHLESLGGRCPFEYVDSLGAPARGPAYIVPAV